MPFERNQAEGDRKCIGTWQQWIIERVWRFRHREDRWEGRTSRLHCGRHLCISTIRGQWPSGKEPSGATKTAERGRLAPWTDGINQRCLEAGYDWAALVLSGFQILDVARGHWRLVRGRQSIPSCIYDGREHSKTLRAHRRGQDAMRRGTKRDLSRFKVRRVLVRLLVRARPLSPISWKCQRSLS